MWWPEKEPPEYPYQHGWIADSIRRGDMAAAQNYLDNAIIEARAANARVLLLSGESFCNLTLPELRKFCSMLPDVECQVLIYLRNVYDLTLSMLCEFMKQSTLLDSLRAIPEPLIDLDFDRRIAHWEEAFGEAAINLRCYDPGGNRLIASFLDFLGIPSEEAETEQLSTYLNVSPDLPVLLFMHLTGHMPDIDYYKNWIVEYTRWFPQGTPRWPMLNDLADIIVSQARTQYRHPGLVYMRDELLRRPSQPAITDDQRRDYLRSMRALIDNMLDES